jgi:succinate dehydrogenase/fumarate reductase flavoprotein subunit
MVEQRVGSIMVVGGGIAGMQAAVDLAKRFFANAAWWRLSIRSPTMSFGS